MKRYFLLSMISLSLWADQTNNLHQYFWANYQHFGGDMQTALTWYNHIFSSGYSIYTYKGFIHFLFDTGNYQEIARLAEKIAEKFSHDPELQFIFARAYAQTGQTAKADQLFIKLNNQFPTNPDIALQAVDVYSRRKELENALQVVDTLLNKSPGKMHYYVFHFLKAQLYAQLNRFEDALKSLQECLTKQPRFDKAWLLFAIIQEQMGKLNEAIQGFTTYLETSPESNPQIEQHLVQLVMKQKGLEQQTTVLHLNKSCLDNALLLFERKQYKLALQHIDTCIVQNPHDPQSKLVKIQILTAMNAHALAVDHLKQWIVQNPEQTGWIKTLYLLSHDKQAYELVLQAFQTLHARMPKNITLVLHLADLHLRSRDKTQAIPYLHTAAHLATDPQLKTKILFQLGICYYEQKNYKRMHDVLEQGYELRTNFPPLLNALAYYYASKGNNLQKAEQLITQALSKSPKNPHFIDTRAFIFYKQKQYTQALNLFNEIAQHHPSDCTIQIHTAKTYCKLGNMPAAQAALTKAQTVAKTETEYATIKKLLTLWNKKST